MKRDDKTAGLKWLSAEGEGWGSEASVLTKANGANAQASQTGKQVKLNNVATAAKTLVTNSCSDC